MLDTKRMRWVPDIKKETLTPESISTWYAEAVVEFKYMDKEYPGRWTLEEYIGNYIFARVTE